MKIAYTLTVGFVAVAGMALAGEKLYNGIELPDEWPPQIDPANQGPMRVPYLEKGNLPNVVPIDLGRQLFVDDFLVESFTGGRRIYNHPVKYPLNPVLWPETEIEVHRPGNSVALPKGGGMWWDADRQVFRLWYETGWCHRMAYAESRDGVHWERPELDVVKGTNRILPNQKVDSWSVIYDPDTTDPEQRWKMQVQPGANPRPNALYVSADGIHWRSVGSTGLCGDRTTAHYNPFRRKWIYSVRGVPRGWPGGYGGRNRSYFETDDFADAHWTWPKDGEGRDPVIWLQADREDLVDPRTGQKKAQLYNFDAVAYESIMLGAFEVHLGPENHIAQQSGMPKITDIVFAYSRDGFHYSRPDRTAAIASERWDSPQWDRGYVQPLGNLCVVMGDELWFYYGAFGGNPTRLEPDNNNNCYYNGMYDQGCMGLAKMRRDGFAGLATTSLTNDAVVLTRPVQFSGAHLFLNLDAPSGGVKTEVLDAATLAPLASFVTERRNSTRMKVGDVGAYAGRSVRLRFTLSRATLYSFWVSAKPTGESGGYLAGGGPGYRSIRDL